jgi:hypothetical protein
MTSDWTAWYDLTGDAEQVAGVAALLWIDARSETDVPAIEALLAQVDAKRLPNAVVIDILNATFPLKERLSSRAAFVETAHSILAGRLGSERAARLMRFRS